MLLRAFEMLRARRPDLRLLLAGPRELGDLPEGVTNLGLVPLAEVERLLLGATAMVLPTLREPFGIAFLDAMACGAPCVGTEVGAISEILGGTQRIVRPGDAAELADAVEEVLNDPVRRAAMGVAGRARVIERGYLWPEVGKRLAGLLERAGTRRRAA